MAGHLKPLFCLLMWCAGAMNRMRIRLWGMHLGLRRHRQRQWWSSWGEVKVEANGTAKRTGVM